MDRDQLSTWLDAYGRAWEEQDPGAAVGLFTEDAEYHETPFQRHMRGREEIRGYWNTGSERQRDVRFRHDVLALEGDRAIVHWWAWYVATASEEPTRLDGIFLLRFEEGGLCSSLREWWHADPRPSF